jgi:hypothetical protein
MTEKMNNLEKLLFSEENNLENLRNDSNETNSNPSKGVGDNSEEIKEVDLKNWNFYENITRENDENGYFLKIDTKKYYKYKLLQHNISETGHNLLIIPGYSAKSGQWTFGRINKFINDGLFKRKKISSINIILFDGLKSIIDELGVRKFYDSTLPFEVSKHIDDVIKKFKINKNLILIGRSAGASHALNIAENDYVISLNLACPGYDIKTLESFNKNSKKDLFVSVYWSSKDRKINLNDSDKGLINFLKIINRPVSTYIYDYIIDETDGKNHRIPKEMIINL